MEGVKKEIDRLFAGLMMFGCLLFFAMPGAAILGAVASSGSRDWLISGSCMLVSGILLAAFFGKKAGIHRN